jgi:hypothetical protein
MSPSMSINSRIAAWRLSAVLGIGWKSVDPAKSIDRISGGAHSWLLILNQLHVLFDVSALS